VAIYWVSGVRQPGDRLLDPLWCLWDDKQQCLHDKGRRFDRHQRRRPLAYRATWPRRCPGLRRTQRLKLHRPSAGRHDHVGLAPMSDVPRERARRQGPGVRLRMGATSSSSQSPVVPSSDVPTPPGPGNPHNGFLVPGGLRAIPSRTGPMARSDRRCPTRGRRRERLVWETRFHDARLPCCRASWAAVRGTAQHINGVGSLTRFR